MTDPRIMHNSEHLNDNNDDDADDDDNDNDDDDDDDDDGCETCSLILQRNSG